MKKIILTCPFTGVAFEALKSADGSLIVQNPLTGENMRIGYNEPSRRYLVDERQFEHIETVSSQKASEILDVSRARISRIIKDDVIPHFKINGKHVFRKDDIMSYAETRSVGRPMKEG